MPRKYSSEKSGFLRLHHRMARKQAALANAYGSSLRFTLTIAGQRARLTFLSHDIDDKGERLLRQAINAASRKGVHSVELDLRQLHSDQHHAGAVIEKTRDLLRHSMAFSVLMPAPPQTAEIIALPAATEEPLAPAPLLEAVA